MKTMKKNLFLSVFTLITTVFFAFALIITTNTGNTVKADTPALAKTNFSVSTNGNYMLLATPITGDFDESLVYEVGYTFTGTQPTTVQAATDKYYTTINGDSAKTLFGDSYTDETPMIVWEIENDNEAVFNAKAYFKVGEIIDEQLYPTEPETKVEGTARNLKVYTITWKDGDDATLKTEKVDYGTVPSYVGATPTKTTSEEYVYAFDAWDNEIVAATANATYTATFTQSLNPVITDAITTISGIRTFIDATDACGDEIDDARAAYDDLTALQKTHVDNYAYLTDSETIYAQKSTLTSIAALNTRFADYSLYKIATINTNVSNYDTALSGLTASQKARMSGYAEYYLNKTNYLLVDDIGVGDDLNNGSRWYKSGGVNNVSNGSTNPNIASALNNATYGKVATVGLNTGANSVIRYNAEYSGAITAEQLAGYKYVIMYAGINNSTGTTRIYAGSDANKTPLTESVLIDNSTRVWYQLKMTVDDFLNKGMFISKTKNSGSVFFSAPIAVYSWGDLDSDMGAYLTALGESDLMPSAWRTYANAVNAINDTISTLPAGCKVQLSSLTNYDAFNLKNFKLVDDIGVGDDLNNGSRWLKPTATISGTTGSGITSMLNGSTNPNIASALNNATYGRVTTVSINTFDYSVFKYNPEYSGAVTAEDLAGYNYVIMYAGINNTTGTTRIYTGTGASKTPLMESVSVANDTRVWYQLKMTVDDFLNKGIYISNSKAGTIWFSAPVAVVE